MRRAPSLRYAVPLAAAVIYAISQVLIKQGVSELAPPLTGATISLFFGTLAFSLVNIRGLNVGLAARKWGVFLFVLSGFLASVGVLLQYIALTITPVIVVSPLTNTNPLWTIIVIHLFLQRLEKITLRIVAGALLVVFGVAMISVGQALA
ncbi:MAG: EamA family transporter [Dehalococcoidia bacterium]